VELRDCFADKETTRTNGQGHWALNGCVGSLRQEKKSTVRNLLKLASWLEVALRTKCSITFEVSTDQTK